MWAARKTSPLGVAALGAPFPLSCRHHDGRGRRAYIFACLDVLHARLSLLRLRRTTSSSTLWFVAYALVTSPSSYGVIAGGFCIAVFVCCYYKYTPYDFTGTSFPRVLLLALLEVCKGPWPPLGGRGEMAMAMVAGLHGCLQ